MARAKIHRGRASNRQRSQIPHSRSNNNPINSNNINRGLCPNGRPIPHISWQTLMNAKRQEESGNHQVMVDYNGDGRIDIGDIVYFLA